MSAPLRVVPQDPRSVPPVAPAEVPAPPTPLDAARYRAAAGRFPTGVTVLTTGALAGLDGVTVSAFVSVSLRPFLAAACINATGRFAGRGAPGTPVALSVLAHDQWDTARRFADPARPRGWPLFQGVPHGLARTSDAPVLHGAVAHIEGVVNALVPLGDHVLAVLDIDHVDVREGEPLVHCDGRPRSLATPLPRTA